MAEPDPGEVVRRAQGGDRQAVEVLVRRFMRPAWLVALSVVKVPVEAEDVAQEAMAMAMQHLGQCREPARFAGWLLSNVRNRALNALASTKVRQRYADSAMKDDEGITGDAERAGLRAQLLAALEVLTPRQREVVLLHDLESWTHPEIADALGISDVSSRQILSGARRQLRDELSGAAPHEPGHGAEAQGGIR